MYHWLMQGLLSLAIARRMILRQENSLGFLKLKMDFWFDCSLLLLRPDESFKAVNWLIYHDCKHAES